MMASARTKEHTGLLLSKLKHGTLYRDRLSGLQVLVLIQRTAGPDPYDVRKRVMTTVVRGRYYNAVYGVHQWMELVDHQLEELPVLRS